MERYVDTGERNGGETTLKLDASLRLLLLLRLLVARVDNLSKHRLDLVDSELLRQLETMSAEIHCIAVVTLCTYFRDVDLLDLQVVQHIREGLERDELSGTDVLLALGKSV